VTRVWRIGARGSPLARAQAERVGARLAARWPGLAWRWHGIETRGDREGERPLPEIGGKGLFTAELERALVEGAIDLAVHSLKDLPTEPVPGLVLVAVPERADPRDVWCVRGPAEPSRPEAAPDGFRVGTSSLRRRALCLAVRPGLSIEPVRGNVGTRLRKLAEGHVDALVLAAAGLGRLGVGVLGRESPIAVHPLDPPDWLPAPGQGALAVQCRADDREALEIVGAIDDPATRAEVEAERALLAALEGGCQVPLGALARVEGDRLRLWAFVASPDGRRVLRGQVEGPRADPETLGRRAAADLRRQGADDLLRSLRAIPPRETDR
jgi:hydroxymethylbilane synthase